MLHIQHLPSNKFRGQPIGYITTQSADNVNICRLRALQGFYYNRYKKEFGVVFGELGKKN